MNVEKLPDGSYVTSQFYMGFDHTVPCEKDHEFETVGDKQPVPADAADMPVSANFMHFQVCKKCKWQRVLLTEG